jgi:hypothetical protein
MRATLAQVEAVLKPLQVGLRDAVVDGGREAAQRAAADAVAYLRAADARYSGVAQPLALREAAMLDEAVEGAEASVLRRIASDPSHSGRPGVLARYSAGVVEDFEQVLQNRFAAKKPWDEVRDELTAKSPFLQGKPAHWAERIVRTEVMAAHNRAGWEVLRRAGDELGDVMKVLSCVDDVRTGSDSLAVHGQIRRPEEAFESWNGSFQHPPDRPNDRAVVVMHRLSWPIPDELKPHPWSEVTARWKEEGRKGSPPARPNDSTVDRSLFGKGEEAVGETPEPPEVSPTETRVSVPEEDDGPDRVPAGDYLDHLREEVPEMFGGQLQPQKGFEKRVAGVVRKVFGDEAPSVSALARTWGSEEGGFDVRIDRVSAERYEPDSDAGTDGSHEMTYTGKIVREGREIGDVVRTFTRHDDGRLEVHHDLFKVEDQASQGKGLGEAMLRQSLRKYRELGVDEVTLDAAWVGRYTWASFGFDWDAETGEGMRRDLADYLEEQGVERQRAEDVAERAARHSWDVASLDVDGLRVGASPERGAPLREERVGKAFLFTHLGWSGTLSLDPASPSFQRAKERLKL